MKPLPPESDEERAQKILEALKKFEPNQSRKYPGINLIWLVTVILLLAIVIVFLTNLPRFKMLYLLLTQPDSLLRQ
ncbi:hypothetical protein HPY86_05265 [candidate division WOR-3 bacterium]|nr:hypothetical protein [candidate division WOR-3 bacterium]